MVNECNDLDKVAEEINEIIRSVWTLFDMLEFVASGCFFMDEAIP